MDWLDRWVILGRRQPALWVLVALAGLGQVVNGWAQLEQFQAGIRWLLKVRNLPPGSHAGTWTTPATSPLWGMLQTGSTLLLFMIMALIFWTVRLAFEQPETPLPWFAPWRRFWIPTLRLGVAGLAFAVVGLMASVVLIPLALVVVIVVGVAGLYCGLDMFLLFLVGALALWLALPWIMPWFVAAVVEHPSGPPEVWERFWKVVRFCRQGFGFLAGWTVVAAVVSWVPHLVLTTVVLSDVFRRFQVSITTFTMPAWFWVVQIVAAGAGGAMGAYFLIGWATAYLEARNCDVDVLPQRKHRRLTPRRRRKETSHG